MSEPVDIFEVTRRVVFSAAHRLNSTFLTAEENVKAYGKCHPVNGHGHNYEVLVTIKGPMNHKTGLALHTDILKEAMKKGIMDTADHKNLDKDVAFFKTNTSTVENICRYIWSEVGKHLDDPKLLYKVVVKESQNNRVTYRGPTYIN